MSQLDFQEEEEQQDLKSVYDGHGSFTKYLQSTYLKYFYFLGGGGSDWWDRQKYKQTLQLDWTNLRAGVNKNITLQ